MHRFTCWYSLSYELLFFYSQLHHVFSCYCIIAPKWPWPLIIQTAVYFASCRCYGRFNFSSMSTTYRRSQLGLWLRDLILYNIFVKTWFSMIHLFHSEKNLTLVCAPVHFVLRSSARRLSSCLIDVLRPCSSGKHYYAWNHITNFYLLALTELFWYDSVSVPHAVPSIVEPKKIEFNDTDTNPTLLLHSGTAGFISLRLSGVTLVTILGIYTV